MFSTWHKLWKSQKPSKNHDVNTVSGHPIVGWSICRLLSKHPNGTLGHQSLRSGVIGSPVFYSFLFELKTKKSNMPGSTTEEQVHSWRASRTLRGFHVQKTKTIQNPIITATASEQCHGAGSSRVLAGSSQILYFFMFFPWSFILSSADSAKHPKTGWTSTEGDIIMIW